MKIAALVSRYLLGLVFLVFGLNGFLQFLPMPAPTGAALQLFTGLGASHLITVIFAIEIAGSVLLLANRFVPLGLVLLAPVIVNIFFFHALAAPEGLPLAILVAALWIVVAVWHKAAFAGLFTQRAD